MHNRGRLVVGSFLTKDLHLDWREGEARFMRCLLDGDEAAQTTATGSGSPRSASTRRPTSAGCTTPTRQQERHDPDGAYVRRWVPELRDVPPERLAEPWTMSAEEQARGRLRDRPGLSGAVVDHEAERRRAMARYGAMSGP